MALGLAKDWDRIPENSFKIEVGPHAKRPSVSLLCISLSMLERERGIDRTKQVEYSWLLRKQEKEDWEADSMQTLSCLGGLMLYIAIHHLVICKDL